MPKGVYLRTLIPNQVRTMSVAEAAYIGAFIDAEGSIELGEHPRISLCNTDVELISALMRAIGTGVVYLEQHESSTHRPIYRFKVLRRNDVRALAEQVAPYSTKAQHMVAYLQERDNGLPPRPTTAPKRREPDGWRQRILRQNTKAIPNHIE